MCPLRNVTMLREPERRFNGTSTDADYDATGQCDTGASTRAMTEQATESASQAPLRDTRGVAKVLIAHLGEQAPCHATHQAMKARQRGDRRTMELWLWIAGAARQILRSEPEGA
jgi:hypothetical protein